LIERCTTLARAAAKRKDDEARAVFEIRRDHLAALATLEPLCDRLAFVRPPFDLANVAATADAFDAGLIVLDYLQRIAPPGEHGDRRGAVDASMSYLRQFADEGVAVMVVAAVARSRDSKGRSSYGEGLNLASFRESSELEFGCDDAFILSPDDDGESVTLRHLKSRNGEPQDIDLIFNRTLQRFTDARPSQPSRGESRKLTASISALWKRTPRASDDREDGEE
jgi:replicative DNA helicase